jgi:hypothetical protein
LRQWNEDIKPALRTFTRTWHFPNPGKGIHLLFFCQLFIEFPLISHKTIHPMQPIESRKIARSQAMNTMGRMRKFL